MSLEQPEARPGRAAVFLLVAAIFIATALAIALVAGAASRSSGSSGDVLVLGPRVRVTHDTSDPNRGSRTDNPTTTSRPDRAGSTTTTTTVGSTATDPTPPSSATGSVAPPSAPPSTAPAVDAPTEEPSVGPAPVVATISAAEIHLHAPVYGDLAASTLDAGTGLWPGSATPGGFGNVVIAGHRTTSSHPFERIGEFEPGDPIVVRDSSGSYTYVVEGSEVVRADRLDVAAPVAGSTLTLIAAHPPGSEQFRYVVRARLVSAPRPPGA